MSVDGSFASGLSAAIAASSHFVIWRWKISAIVSGDSCSLSTPLTLYDSVIGPSRTGKYRIGSAGLSASANAASDPAKSTVLLARSVRPLPEPPPPYVIVVPPLAFWNASIASCWYASWNVEPLPCSVPLTFSGVELAEPALVVGAAVEAAAAVVAAPAAVAAAAAVVGADVVSDLSSLPHAAARSVIATRPLMARRVVRLFT